MQYFNIEVRPLHGRAREEENVQCKFGQWMIEHMKDQFFSFFLEKNKTKLLSCSSNLEV